MSTPNSDLVEKELRSGGSDSKAGGSGDRGGAANSGRNSLDGFFSNVLDQLRPNGGGAAGASGSGSKPPLPPSSKRKRDEASPPGSSLLGSNASAAAPPATPYTAEQVALLEKTIFQELENGLLSGLYAQQQQQLGGAAAPSIRSASPNSISIANALSLFAANCLHQYTSAASSAAAASAGASPSPAVNSVLFADQATPLTKKMCTSEEVESSAGEAMMKIEALDTSTTSEESDDEASPSSAAPDFREYSSSTIAV